MLCFLFFLTSVYLVEYVNWRSANCFFHRKPVRMPGGRRKERNDFFVVTIWYGRRIPKTGYPKPIIYYSTRIPFLYPTTKASLNP
ncbi:MAG: hypothetical protein ACI8YQ_004462, partial [Polaribacter sp.]